MTKWLKERRFWAVMGGITLLCCTCGNIKQAEVFWKRIKVKYDLRTIDRAIRASPPRVPAPSHSLREISLEKQTGRFRAALEGLARLEIEEENYPSREVRWFAPRWVASAFDVITWDPFAEPAARYRLFYWGDIYFLVSVGPDGGLQFAESAVVKDGKLLCPAELIVQLHYDPTNGVICPGTDIILDSRAPENFPYYYDLKEYLWKDQIDPSGTRLATSATTATTLGNTNSTTEPE